MKKILTVFVALMFVVGFSTASWALVPFSQNTGFDLNSVLSTDGGSPTNDIDWATVASVLPNVVTPTNPNPQEVPAVDLYNTLTWGLASVDSAANESHWGDSNYSGLQLFGFSGQAQEDNWTTISRIFHQNNSIPIAAKTLSSVDIFSILTVGTDDRDKISVNFLETTNSGTCDYSLGAPCADKWSFDGTSFDPVSFVYNGQPYLAEFRLANLVNAEDDYSGFPTVNLWTAEGLTSSADVQMKLHAVPEPASMLLFGLGMVGAAIRKRIFG